MMSMWYDKVAPMAWPTVLWRWQLCSLGIPWDAQWFGEFLVSFKVKSEGLLQRTSGFFVTGQERLLCDGLFDVGHGS